MPEQPKRRFLGLDTDEVSLVDSPANEVEFLVAKNRGDSDMADSQDNATDSTPTTDVEKVAVDVETGDGDGVAAALKSVTQIVDSIAGVVKAAKGDDPPADPPADETDTAKAKPKVLADKKAKEEADKKAKEEADKKAKEEADKKAKTTKADPPADPPAEEVETDKAKAFTPARIAQMEGMVKTLQGLLDAVRGEAKTTKSADALAQVGPALETITETLKSVNDGMKALTERVSKIEGERAPSNSAEEDGGTDTPTAKQQDIWNGVL